MRRLVVAAMAVVAGAVCVACGGSPSAAMPAVEGERLDVAYSDLAAAGVDRGDVEIVGGGTFGVVVESNWVVCEQRPNPGDAVASVRLVVDRSCSRLSSGGGTSGEDQGSDATTDETGGGESFAMPDVVGMVLQDAQDLLQAQGSYLMDQEDASGMGRLQILDSNWKVCSQVPAAGSPTDVATVVTLSAVKLSESCP